MLSKVIFKEDRFHSSPSSYTINNAICMKSEIENGEHEMAEAVKSGSADTREALVLLVDPPSAAHLI